MSFSSWEFRQQFHSQFIVLALNNQIYDYLKDNDLYIRPAHQKQTIEPKPTNTHTFTVTRYKGIGENPIVVLIDHPTQQGTIVNTLEELRKILAQHDECIYFVADKDDNRLHGLNNWHDECDNYAVVDRIEAYLDAKNESELNSLENS